MAQQTNKNQTIVGGRDEYGDYYAARLYNTNVVRYYQNGDISLHHDGHETASTARFIWAVSGFSCSLLGHYIWVRTGDDLFIIPPQGLHLKKPTPEHPYSRPTNPVQLYARSYNRETTKRIRARVKPVLDYCKVILKVGVGRSYWPVNGDLVAKMFAGEPLDTPELAALFNSGYGALEALYSAAVMYRFCTEDELYIYTPYPIGKYKKGLVML